MERHRQFQRSPHSAARHSAEETVGEPVIEGIEEATHDQMLGASRRTRTRGRILEPRLNRDCTGARRRNEVFFLGAVSTNTYGIGFIK
jgi:hypothetical protein